jgi:hypothetical protein
VRQKRSTRCSATCTEPIGRSERACQRAPYCRKTKAKREALEDGKGVESNRRLFAVCRFGWGIIMC